MKIEEAIKIEESALEYLLSEGNNVPEQVIELRKMELAALRAQQKITMNETKTNADRIRAMSNEELATLLCCTGWRLSERKDCLDWLQQPAEVEE